MRSGLRRRRLPSLGGRLSAPVRHALAEALGVTAAPALDGPTVGVDGAAALLKCSRSAIYIRRSRGQLPRPVTARPLVWRVADLLKMGA